MSQQIVNPLDASLENLFNHLATFDGFAFILQSHLKGFRLSLEQRRKTEGLDLSRFSAWVSLNLIDLTQSPSSGWVERFHASSFGAEGQDYIALTDTFVSIWSCQAIADSYEAFETFLQDIIADFLHDHPGKADPDKFRKAFQYVDRVSTDRTTQEYWRDCVRRAFRRDQSDLLDFIRALAPRLAEVENNNGLGIDLKEWHSLVTTVRHAVTHSDLRIIASQMRDWTPYRCSLLEKKFPGSYQGYDYKLKIDRDSAHEALVLFGDYAYVIYKLLSAKGGYLPDIPPTRSQGTQTVLANDS